MLGLGEGNSAYQGVAKKEKRATRVKIVRGRDGGQTFTGKRRQLVGLVGSECHDENTEEVIKFLDGEARVG